MTPEWAISQKPTGLSEDSPVHIAEDCVLFGPFLCGVEGVANEMLVDRIERRLNAAVHMQFFENVP